MLDLLPASRSHPEFFPRSVIAALVVHLLVVRFDIAATRSVVKATEASHRAEPVLLLMPHSADPLIQGELPRNPRIGPPPERFQHIPFPQEQPPAVPPIDWSRRPFGPRDFLRLVRFVAEK